MLRRLATNCLTVVATMLVASSVAAAEPVRTEVFLTSAAGARAFSLVSSGSAGSYAPASAQMDYALFATELAAYLAKEILPDSAQEYTDSPLGSRWNRTMPETESHFGDHCLKIVTSIGAAMPMPSFRSVGVTSPSPAEVAVRGATAALALRQIWEAFKNDVQDDRSGVSLRPKVSSRRVGVNVTFHW